MRMNGCHNGEPPRDTVTVQDGWRLLRDPETGEIFRWPVVVTIRNPMTKDCQYSRDPKNALDPRCAGCKRKQEPETK